MIGTTDSHSITGLDEESMKCQSCGCTDDDCRQCIERTGFPCCWVAPSKCSACFDETGELREE